MLRVQNILQLQRQGVLSQGSEDAAQGKTGYPLICEAHVSLGIVGFPCPLSIFIIVRDSIPAFSASKTWVSPTSVRVVRNQAAKVAFGSCIMFHLIPILQVLFLREKELRFLFLMHHKSRLRKLGIYSMINARTSIEIIVVYSF